MGAGAILQGLTNAAIAGRTGQLQGQQVANQRATELALLGITQQRAAQQAAVENALKMAQAQAALGTSHWRQAQVDALQHPKIAPESWTFGPAKVNGKDMLVKRSNMGKIEDLSGNDLSGATVEPYAPPQPVSYTGVPGAVPGQVFDPKHPQAGVVTIPGVTPKPATGAATAALAAPMAAKVGQYGELLKKTPDILNAMDGLEVGLQQSTASDIAEKGFMGLPGTRGIGNLMLNRTPEYAQYNAALAPWILAAAHAISGARINQQQIDQIEQSVKIQPGDLNNPTVLAQKRKNLMDLVNSIGGSLPGDAVTEQEAQMPAGDMARLKTYGYEANTGKAAPSPAPKPSGGGAGATPTAEQALWDAAVKLHGKAVVLKEYGPRPGGE